MTRNKFFLHAKAAVLATTVFFGVFFYYSTLIQGCNNGSIASCIFLLK